MKWFTKRDPLYQNDENTPVPEIINQMREKRALPMGRSDFEQWSDRIISGALVAADITSQRYALANLLLHLGPTESHKEDSFFIHSLRKFAVNQVADEIRKEIYEARKGKPEEGVTSAVPITAMPAAPTVGA